MLKKNILLLSYDSEVNKLQKFQNQCMRNILEVNRANKPNFLSAKHPVTVTVNALTIIF